MTSLVRPAFQPTADVHIDQRILDTQGPQAPAVGPIPLHAVNLGDMVTLNSDGTPNLSLPPPTTTPERPLRLNSSEQSPGGTTADDRPNQNQGSQGPEDLIQQKSDEETYSEKMKKLRKEQKEFEKAKKELKIQQKAAEQAKQEATTLRSVCLDLEARLKE